MQNTIQTKAQTLVLENRKKLSLTGVEDVSGFNEETVTAATSLGDLIIRGSKLHIEKLDLESGEVEIEGEISALQYTRAKRDKSFFQRVFS